MHAASVIHNQQLLAVRAWRCESLLECMLGGWGPGPWPDNEFLVWLPGRALLPGRWLHSFGLRQLIDIVFTDARGQVLRCVRRLPPRRVVWQPRAQAAWAARAGLVGVLGIEPGSWLRLRGIG